MISIHAPRVGSDAALSLIRVVFQWISIHAPRVGSDDDDPNMVLDTPISIHAPRVGSDATSTIIIRASSIFQSTLPAWGATGLERPECRVSPISIHAPRVGSDDGQWTSEAAVAISIHAPRVGSDRITSAPQKQCFAFQSTLPAWGATRMLRNHLSRHLFQSTLPAWGATSATASSLMPARFQSTLPAWGATAAAMITATRTHFNPRSPRGERLRALVPLSPFEISIHAPRVGSDPGHDKEHDSGAVFQSTLPAWGATYVEITWTPTKEISIHAPRVGSDSIEVFVACDFVISIHAPRVGSDDFLQAVKIVRVFQSTLPAWGATKNGGRKGDFCRISIHAPRVGSDDDDRQLDAVILHFNPRSPRGERPQLPLHDSARAYFNPRSPRGERLVAP